MKAEPMARNENKSAVSWREKIQYATITGKLDVVPRERCASWDEIVQHLADVEARAEKDGPALIGAIFGHPHRADDCVDRMTLLLLDLDGKNGSITREQIADRLRGRAFVAHTTHSSTPECRRWRIVLPYASPVSCPEHRATFDHLQRLFDGMLDSACKNPSHFFYGPSCPPERLAEFEHISGDGEPLDPASFVCAEAQAQGFLRVAPGSNGGNLRVNDEMKRLIVAGRPKGQRSEALYAAIRAMAKLGHADSEIAAVLLDPANRLSEKPRELGAAWLQGEINRARRKPDECTDDHRAAHTTIPNDPLQKVISAADLARLTLPEPRWIFDHLIPEGLTLFAGKSKMGKSWWMLQLGLQVAAKGGETLYLALEDTLRRMQDRLLKQCGTADAVPAGLHLFDRSGWPRLDAGCVEALRRWLVTHPNTRLIIIDTLAKIRARTKGNANVYEEDYAALSELKSVADEFGIGIVVVHHLRKMVDPTDPFTEISGSTGLVGCADTIMVLKRDRNSDKADLYITGRDVEEAKLLMVWQPISCTWAMTDDTHTSTEPKELAGSKKKIIELLEKVGPMTMREIIDALGIPDGTVKSALNRMTTIGQLVNDDGRYSPQSLKLETGGTKETRADDATGGTGETNAENEGADAAQVSRLRWFRF